MYINENHKKLKTCQKSVKKIGSQYCYQTVNQGDSPSEFHRLSKVHRLTSTQNHKTKRANIKSKNVILSKYHHCEHNGLVQNKNFKICKYQCIMKIVPKF